MCRSLKSEVGVNGLAEALILLAFSFFFFDVFPLFGVEGERGEVGSKDKEIYSPLNSTPSDEDES